MKEISGLILRARNLDSADFHVNILGKLPYAKVSDHEHSKFLKSSNFQLLPNKVEISF